MKSLLLFVALLCAVTFSSSSLPVSNASTAGQKQKAVTQFNQPVRLRGVVLKGEYLFVHDDAAMMRGEACTYVYKGNAEVADKLVVSFRCLPALRAKAAHFTVRTVEVSPGVWEVREFQFGGDSEAHFVPPAT